MRTALTAIIVLVFGLSVPAFAQTTDESPRLPAVKNAIKQYEVAAEKARKEYLMALIDLDRRLITDMEGALKQVMQAGNLDEAKRIEAAVLTAKETMGKHQDELRGKVRVQEQTFTIKAGSSGWQQTIEVRKGKMIQVTASGQWCADPGRRAKYTVGPEAIVDGVWFGLMGRINDGPDFKIGSEAKFFPDRDGTLYLRLGGGSKTNDDDGEVTADIVSAR